MPLIAKENLINQNFLLKSTHNHKKFSVDVRQINTEQPKPMVVFVHGFKGFKDWGTFNLLADSFAQAGFIFLKFNLSHNGTSPENPSDFVDLDAFFENNFSIELDDLGVVADYLHSTACEIPNLDRNRMYLLGHSRGGGIAILKAKEDQRFQKVATLAAYNGVLSRYREDALEHWKEEGVRDVWNGRTKQHMPMGYQFVQDAHKNAERLDIPKAVAEMKQPLLLIHGAEDTTVKVETAHQLHALNSDSKLFIIPTSDHTFGGYHPYDLKVIPYDLQEAFDELIKFYKD